VAVASDRSHLLYSIPANVVACAISAYATARLGINTSIGLVVSVALRAVRFLNVHLNPSSAPSVFSLCSQPNVVWPNTGGYLAEVVAKETIGNRPIDLFVKPTVSLNNLASVEHELPVPALLYASHPEPTAICLVDLAPKPNDRFHLNSAISPTAISHKGRVRLSNLLHAVNDAYGLVGPSPLAAVVGRTFLHIQIAVHCINCNTAEGLA